MSGSSTCACAEARRVGGAASGADTCAVILAGGTGERFGDPRGKQFVELCGLPLMSWSVMAFDHATSISSLVIVCAPDKVALIEKDVLANLTLAKPVAFAPSGATRQDSVFSGLSAVPDDARLIAVHDSARPLIEVEAIERCCAAVRADATLAGAICANRSVDTLKLVEGNQILATPNRSFYWAAQTPQIFRAKQLVAAYKAAFWDGFAGTDDSSLVERHGGRVICVECSRDNIKVTLPEDLAVAAATLEQRLVDEGCGRMLSGKEEF
ncbi:2-C-methyl-D-erythritol 4-phosphate cytidylyltransferase [Paratractidigestivibacter sp.]|uniref:2-C-methyl-D-erythritol 4-phosphate cytidylyltransferase n=1 Tax=Paratractidigestivibacter sp. TaxID=2847316 RepID=UPI002ABE2035|nr:2-C-methyl-D-erythritol 4-phosphate cytidylyltransferase [Paratractidigestivibacter sp.]